MSRPAEVRALGAAQSGTSWLEIVLTEGKNRQVRRMCASVGHDVEEFVRVAVGELRAGRSRPRAVASAFAAGGGPARREARDNMGEISEDFPMKMAVAARR